MRILYFIIFLTCFTFQSFGQKAFIERYEPYSLQTICENFLNNSIVESWDDGVCAYIDDTTENCLNYVLELYDDKTYKLYEARFQLINGEKANVKGRSQEGSFVKKKNELLLTDSSGEKKKMQYNNDGDGLQWQMGNRNDCDHTYHFFKVESK